MNEVRTPLNTSGSSVSSQNESIKNNDLSHSSNENVPIGGRTKSAISIVQEIAQKHDLPIRFDVDKESGPAHMKHFTIVCTVGELTVSYNKICSFVNDSN